jgi:hypothetical protein
MGVWGDSARYNLMVRASTTANVASRRMARDTLPIAPPFNNRHPEQNPA